MIRLKDRMSKIVKMAEPVEAVADVGCDHGKVSAALLQSGRAERVIAVDVSADSLKKAHDLSQELGLACQMICRNGYGLRPLESGEVQAVIMAGMGGTLMIDILNDRLELVKNLEYLVLAPNSASDRIRLFLSEGFTIVDEELAMEGDHFYPIIKAVPGGNSELSIMELALGPVLLQKKPPYFKKYVEYKMSLVRKMIEELESSGHSSEDLKRHLEDYEEVMKCLPEQENSVQ